MAGYFKDNKGAASEAGKKGSRKGVPNKTTKEIRDSFQMFVENNVSKFQEWIDEVGKTNPAKAIELVANLGEYILPKLSRTEIEADITAEVKPKIDYSKLDKETLKRVLEALKKGE
ncbi:MAG: hypothetical protein GOVbin4342_32 [Prokaryotic dsDNA virus sp.]|nr:MAG: hypothetical protein GOVbin4342_32 [Prokaryotic dsDNA virus sp.]|tara:strand:+ start:119 stop:466 length:348 start_codon:yes stop_codon:yes gene_type:complete